MARRAGTTKRETHDRIVKTAASAIREHGYAGVSVAEVMERAGLTHGGFYAHFESREAMLAEALDRAADEAVLRLAGATDGAADPLDALVTTYLSDRHLATPAAGCTIASLGSETARQSPEIRAISTRRVNELVALVARTLPSGTAAERRTDALAVTSALVGAITVARSVGDPALAQSVRDAAARSIKAIVAARATKRS